jgi:HEAT repeat protein
MRAAAAWGLGQMDTKKPETVALLRKLLVDESPNVRAQAAGSLGEMGRAGQVAVKDLERLLKDEDEWVREIAGYAIQQLREQ